MPLQLLALHGCSCQHHLLLLLLGLLLHVPLLLLLLLVVAGHHVVTVGVLVLQLLCLHAPRQVHMRHLGCHPLHAHLLLLLLVL
jgi:hypothetical protein